MDMKDNGTTLTNMAQMLYRIPLRYWAWAVVCFLAAVMFGGAQWKREYTERERMDWKGSQATVLNAEAHEYFWGNPGFGMDLEVYAGVTVEYEIDGVRYRATTDIDGLSTIDNIEERLPPGKLIWILYDPDDPSRIYYNIGEVTLVYSDLTWLMVTLVLLGTGILVIGWRQSLTQ